MRHGPRHPPPSQSQFPRLARSGGWRSRTGGPSDVALISATLRAMFSRTSSVLSLMLGPSPSSAPTGACTPSSLASPCVPAIAAIVAGAGAGPHSSFLPYRSSSYLSAFDTNRGTGEVGRGRRLPRLEPRSFLPSWYSLTWALPNETFRCSIAPPGADPETDPEPRLAPASSDDAWLGSDPELRRHDRSTGQERDGPVGGREEGEADEEAGGEGPDGTREEDERGAVPLPSSLAAGLRSMARPAAAAALADEPVPRTGEGPVAPRHGGRRSSSLKSRGVMGGLLLGLWGRS